MLLQKFGDDFVTVLQFFFKLTDFLFVGILLPFQVGLVGTSRKGTLGILEKLLLPLVVLRGVNAEFIAQVGYWNVLEQVATNDRYLLLRRITACGWTS